MVELYSDMKKGFCESVPPSIWNVVEELLGNPMWLEICDVIYKTPMNAHMTQSQLIMAMNNFIEENHIDYLELSKNLDTLNRKGYIHFEAHSMLDYFLTPIAVEAMKVINVIEKQIVPALVEELRQQGLDDANIEKHAKRGIYSSLTSKKLL